MARQRYEKFKASNVEIGEVSAVGFVQIVVAFEESTTGRRDHGLEEGSRADLRSQANTRGADVGEKTSGKADLVMCERCDRKLGDSTYVPRER